MAVVRPRQRRPAWLPVAIVAGSLVIVLVAVAGAAWWSTRRSSTPDVDARIQQMVAELDVLAISLYTDDVVRNGQVLAPEEYEAARRAVQRIREQWQAIQPAVPAESRTAVDSLLTELETAIDSRADPRQVATLVATLQERLRSLTS